ncbi:transpeptidase family protein [bacterium]|nr:transpeptidase family protein [bacterium]
MGSRKKHSDRHNRRLFSLGFIFPGLMVCVLARSFWFQVIQPDKWIVLAGRQYETQKVLPARRGTIYDRDLNILAMDLPGASLAVDPTLVIDKERFVKTLSKVLRGEQAHYQKLLFSDNKTEYVYLLRAILPQQRDSLEEAGLEGLIFDKAMDRNMPGKDLALQLIGITDLKRNGASGVELSFDRWIHGRDGWAIRQKDAFNRSHVSLDYPVERPVAGQSVVLTLDHVLQTVVEEELEKSVLRHKAKAGIAVLMNPYSGEILVMANKLGHSSRTGTVDFNRKMCNLAVQWDFEPGSTFKIVTLAAALERGGYTPDSLVFCENGAYRLGNHIVNDHEAAFGWLSLSRVIEESSNIGVAKIARSLGASVMYEYARNFGFGNKTAIQLPGESSGLLRPLYKWQQYSPAFISFGQELSATTLQVAAMISVIANGGELVKPRIVSKIVDMQGDVVKSFKKQVIRRVITRRTAAGVAAILERVVMHGSGDEAAVKGIRVAGKTGTAQKSVPGYRGYLPNTRVASFAGFWPADAPRYALVVVLDEPTYKYWGSHSAAPLFSRIVNRIEGIPDPGSAPAFAGNKDEFSFVSMQKNNDGVIDEPESTPIRTYVPDHVIPSVVGMSMRKAMRHLAALGVEVQIKGHGCVAEQKPAVGTPLAEGLCCQLIGEELPGDDK